MNAMEAGNKQLFILLSFVLQLGRFAFGEFLE
jgi:hypothetical protein